MASSFFVCGSHENPAKNPDKAKSVRIRLASGLAGDFRVKIMPLSGHGRVLVNRITNDP